MATAIPRRVLSVTFTLEGGQTFDANGDNVTTVSHLRTTAEIEQNGGLATRHLSLRIYGLTLSVMSKLVVLGKPIAAIAKNFVSVSAGDDGGSLSEVFRGEIFQAWIDASAAPEIALVVDANEAQYAGTAPANPTSYAAPVSVVTVLEGIATQMNLTLEATDVNITLPKVYLPGTLRDQAFAVAQMANINLQFEGDMMIAFPKGGHRPTPDVPLISKDTGLVGYPTHTQNGVAVTTLFNPEIRFGAVVKVDSVILPLQGRWIVYALNQQLSSETPDGPWFTTAQCVPLGQPVPIPS